MPLELTGHQFAFRDEEPNYPNLDSKYLNVMSDFFESGNVRSFEETDQAVEYLWNIQLQLRPETAFHAWRMRAYAEIMLSDSTSFTPRQKENAMRGALVHDIGKIAPYFRKQYGSGREDKQRSRRSHASVGGLILARLGMNQDICAIAFDHHCNYDGTGLPNLKGEEIPLLARVFRYIDSFDAAQVMLTMDEAIEKIQARIGTQFDPNLWPNFEYMTNMIRFVNPAQHAHIAASYDRFLKYRKK